MYQPGDIVEIVATEDDETSQKIAGSIAEIVRQDSTLYSNKETYKIRFIDLKDSSYSSSVSFWQSKNLKYANNYNNIAEEDIMALLGGG